MAKTTAIGSICAMTTRPPGSLALTHVAGIHETQSDASGERRRDARVRELDLDELQLPWSALTAPSAPAARSPPGCRTAGARDHLLVDEHAVALEVEPRVLERRHVAGELALRLRELRLEGAGVDLRKQLALAHELALAEERLQKLAVDAAADGDGVERRDGAERGEGDGQVAGASEAMTTGVARGPGAADAPPEVLPPWPLPGRVSAYAPPARTQPTMTTAIHVRWQGASGQTSIPQAAA